MPRKPKYIYHIQILHELKFREEINVLTSLFVKSPAEVSKVMGTWECRIRKRIDKIKSMEHQLILIEDLYGCKYTYTIIKYTQEEFERVIDVNRFKKKKRVRLPADI